MSDNNDNNASVLLSRLLCAAKAAYGIGFDGQPDFSEEQPQFAHMGLVDAPSHWTGGEHRQHACLVATIEDPGAGGSAVVLAFRGTHPPEVDNLKDAAGFVEDWTNDFQAELVAVEGIGEVHGGFWEAVEALWSEPFLAEIDRRLGASGSGRLYLTGHSKGGAMAPLAALRLHQSGRPVTAVHTFAAARAGTASFAAAYAAAGIDGSRYEFGDDIVPHLPPSSLLRDTLHHELSALSAGGFQVLGDLARMVSARTSGVAALAAVIGRLQAIEYVSVGELRYINRSGQVLDGTPELERQRLLSLFLKLVKPGGVRTVATDHSVDCASGYGKAVYGAGVCG